MKLLHTTPCNECPWRRSHMPGWLGGYTPEQFVGQVQHDGPPLPCHKTIKEGKSATALCVGALIFMKNSCKSAQHPDYGNAKDGVERDTDTVFQWPQEFLAHHKQDLSVWAKEKIDEAKAKSAEIDCTD